MKTSTRQHLPLAPLLHAYTRAGVPSMGELHHLPNLGPRFAAILSATVKFLFADFLDNASAADLGDAVVRFYEACVQPPLHVETLRRRAGIVRHGLAYLLCGRDPLPIKAAACLDASGAYHVAGLGPSFWSALLQALATLASSRLDAGYRCRIGASRAWRPGEAATARRRSTPGCCPPMSAFRLWSRPCRRCTSIISSPSSLPCRAAIYRGNDALAELSPDAALRAAIQQERSRLPLRERLKDRGQTLARGQEQMETALANSDGKGIGDALAAANLEGCLRSPLDWGEHAETLTLWVGRLWESDDPYRTLAAFWNADPLPGAGLWLPAAVLHLRDPQNFAPWDEAIRAAYAALDDSAGGDHPAAERYRLFNEGVAWLRQRHQLHPLEMPAILAGLDREEVQPEPASFRGFCADTFHFLGELAHNNKREWMERQRDRYRFAVREPLIELCRALAERYVEPVLRGLHGWSIDTEPRSGRALTSICKNAYGRTQPYNSALWIAFCRRTERGRREDVQFFVRLDGDGLRYGLRLGRKARGAPPAFPPAGAPGTPSCCSAPARSRCFARLPLRSRRFQRAGSNPRHGRRSPRLERGSLVRDFALAFQLPPRSCPATNWPARSC